MSCWNPTENVDSCVLASNYAKFRLQVGIVISTSGQFQSVCKCRLDLPCVSILRESVWRLGGSLWTQFSKFLVRSLGQFYAGTGWRRAEESLNNFMGLLSQALPNSLLLSNTLLVPRAPISCLALSFLLPELPCPGQTLRDLGGQREKRVRGGLRPPHRHPRQHGTPWGRGARGRGESRGVVCPLGASLSFRCRSRRLAPPGALSFAPWCSLLGFGFVEVKLRERSGKLATTSVGLWSR